MEDDYDFNDLYSSPQFPKIFGLPFSAAMRLTEGVVAVGDLFLDAAIFYHEAMAEALQMLRS